MDYRSAALFALAISLTMYVLSSIMFLYGREAVIIAKSRMPEFDAVRLLASAATSSCCTSSTSPC
jgi:hypothetical protein